MTGPFIYVGTWTIKDGKFEEARKWLAEHTDFIETNEPRLIAFHVFFDHEGTTASVVQVHPDAESMEFHMKLIAEHMSDAFEYIDHIVSEQYYGPKTEALAEELSKWEDPGVTVVSRPVHEAGFTRASVR